MTSGPCRGTICHGEKPRWNMEEKDLGDIKPGTPKVTKCQQPARDRAGHVDILGFDPVMMTWGLWWRWRSLSQRVVSSA
jgi:hypothetical protein